MKVIPVMKFSAKGLSWLLVLVTIAIIASVALAWWKYHEQTWIHEPVAQVNDVSITRENLAEALLKRVWREDLDWTSLDVLAQQTLRTDVLDSLIKRQMVQQFTRRNPVHDVKTVQQSEETFQQFLKQFEPAEAWAERAAGQELDEVQLREILTREVQDQNTLEAALAEKVTSVSDEEVQTWFEANQETLMIPERVKISHVFLTRHDKENPDRAEEIGELHQQLVSRKKTFAELAAEFSDDERSKRQEGNLGWVTRKRLPQDFAEKAFEVAVGEISEPFETSLGWHIVKIEAKNAASLPDIAAVKEEIRAKLETQKRQTSLQALMQELRAGATVETFPTVIRTVNPL